MKLLWEIEHDDIQKLREFYNSQHNNLFVRKRIEKNVKQKRPEISLVNFFHAMVACLITTQQRSGPDSAVSKFLNVKPFPLSYDRCRKSKNLRSLVQKTITDFGGLRRANKIADEITTNLTKLEKSLWDQIYLLIKEMMMDQTVHNERETADFINDNLKGFGPKQSRNILQLLGLTKYEIPIDSRITKWLNEFGFPVKLSANALSDHNYYNFISDGIQYLCKQAEIMPCALDAAIFSSFDAGGWTEDNIIW